MSVMVYSRLGELLRDRNLTVRDLQQRIAARFGLAVGARTLDRLARAERVRRPDLEVAAAAAETLGVSLNDVFAVDTTPIPAARDNTAAAEVGNVDDLLDDEDDVLDPEQSRRLQHLFDLRDRRPLHDDEVAEQNALIAEWSHRVNERTLRSIAAKRGQPLEQTRSEVAADFERVMAWWTEVQSDPARYESLVQESLDQQQARAAG